MIQKFLRDLVETVSAITKFLFGFAPKSAKIFRYFLHVNTLQRKLLGLLDNLHLALRTGQTHFKRNRGPNTPTRPEPQGGVLSTWDSGKGHGEETSQPDTAHWLLPFTGFFGRYWWGPNKKAGRQSRETSWPWDNWSRDPKPKLCSLLPCQMQRMMGKKQENHSD